MALRLESAAPSLKVSNWVHGEPLTHFQSGKVYIVEFWATWCGPCVTAMPGLVQLQDRYRDSGLDVIGVAASERAGEEARTMLDAWLTENLPSLNFRIAFDYRAEMHRLWMAASFSFGIPTSFIVNGDGHIAFIGDPTKLDDVLPKVLDGSWRTSAEAKTADKERIAEGETYAAEIAFHDRISAVIEIKDWNTALSAIEEGINLNLGSISLRRLHVETLIGRMRDMEAGWIALDEFARTAIERHSEDWLLAAMQELFGPHYDYSGLPLEERFSMGKELSESILRLCSQQDPFSIAVYATIAPYHHESGDKERAADLIEQGLDLIDGVSVPDENKRKIQASLLRTLAEYKGEEVCHGGTCVAPKKQTGKEEAVGAALWGSGGMTRGARH
ncbi:TlpA disulfide reductase family protein [Rhizobium ruizarguesonis]